MDYIPLILHNFLSFIAIISIIVFIHEFGHYWVAKKCGVKIDAFSIGFGKELWGWNDKSGTRWKIAVFPLGGYVKMFGDEGAASTPDSEKLRKLTPEEEKVAFHTQPLWAKALIVFAGPLANFILAFAILTTLYMVYGRQETSPIVGHVVENSAAAEIGLQEGDKILSLNDEEIKRFEDIPGIVMLYPEQEISITYLRGGEVIADKITPRLEERDNPLGSGKQKVGIIGIGTKRTLDYHGSETMSFFPAVKASVIDTYNFCARTMTALGQIITGKRSHKELSGVISIAEYSGTAVTVGMAMILWFMAILSINLGLINLFPIPMLDGGHLLFYAVEAASGRPLAEKVQEYAFRAGFVFIILLMGLTIFNDLDRILSN